MSEWTVKHFPNDGWYQYRVYEGDTLIANIPQRGKTARSIAEQIVASRAREAALVRAILRWDTMRRQGDQQEADTAHRRMLEIVADYLRRLPRGEEEELMLAAATASQGAATHSGEGV